MHNIDLWISMSMDILSRPQTGGNRGLFFGGHNTNYKSNWYYVPRKRAALVRKLTRRRQLQSNQPGNNQPQADEAYGIGRLTKQEYPEDCCADSTNTHPNSVSRS